MDTSSRIWPGEQRGSIGLTNHLPFRNFIPSALPFLPLRQTERQETIARIGEDLFAIAVDQPFRFPANFTFVLRAFSTLEGIGKTLDPGYKFSEVAQPYAKELLDLQDSAQTVQLFNQVQQQATALTQNAAAMPVRIQRIDSLLEQLEAGDLKLRVRDGAAVKGARGEGAGDRADKHHFVRLAASLPSADEAPPPCASRCVRSKWSARCADRPSCSRPR